MFGGRHGKVFAPCNWEGGFGGKIEISLPLMDPRDGFVMDSGEGILIYYSFFPFYIR